MYAIPSTSHTDCHSSCKSCLRGNDSTACTSCNDDSLEVAGDPAGPCQPPGKKGSSSVSLHPLLYVVCEVIF